MFNDDSFNSSFKAINLELRNELRDVYAINCALSTRNLAPEAEIGKIRYNRLHSIAEDAAFVSDEVRPAYPHYPVVPNQRCGAWYVAPELDEHYAYFKSTDGHIGEHAFRLRRANLALVPIISEFGGIVIVDSTRRGKRFPDALSKTIPIWCAVLNLARSRLRQDPLNDDGRLWTLPTVVGRSEHTQIEVQIEEWTDSLLNSSYDLTHIKNMLKPLRPIFVSPASTFSTPRNELNYYPVVCVSASKLAKESDVRERGFAYVQGAGDDHETWAKGLTPALFWLNAKEILHARRSEIDDVIARLLSWSKELVAAIKPVSRIRETLISLSFGATHVAETEDEKVTISISAVPTIFASATTFISTKNSVMITTRSGKPGHDAFFHGIAQTVDLCTKGIEQGKGVEIIVLQSESQKEANDYGVALATILLMLCYTKDGKLAKEREIPTKVIIRERTNWILEAFPAVNPTRSILIRINAFLIAPFN